MGIIEFLFGSGKTADHPPAEQAGEARGDDGHSRINELFTDWHKMLYDEYPNIYTRKLCEAYLNGETSTSFEIAVPERQTSYSQAILDKFAHRIRDDIETTAKALGLPGCRVSCLSYEKARFAVTVDVGNAQN